MTTVADARHAHVHSPAVHTNAPVRIALLGVGQVGGALAALVRQPPLSLRFCVASGLVRDTSRARPNAADVHLTANLRDALVDGADVVIEALGGVEPACTLVLRAIERRIPVVTANKSLLAAAGDVLLDAAARAGVPLRYEATVLAGVPFLGTFARRPLARDITGLCGVVNGTTNFILSTMSHERHSFGDAVAEAQRRGYAEPDPANDLQGVDAAEKLCVLVRHFGNWSVPVTGIETSGITSLEAADLQAAAEFDGALKPVVYADWREGTLSAFAGPAFLFSSHPLARVNGVQNAVRLRNRAAGELFFAGPGAGPAVTAATLLDDAGEVAGFDGGLAGGACPSWNRGNPKSPTTGWFVRISGDRVPEAADVADLFSAYGIWLRRTSERAGDRRTQRWFLTHGSTQPRIVDALRALGTAAGCQTFCARILED